MSNLPTGTVTFLFTDIEGSTRLWEQHPEETGAALIRHDAIVEEIVEAHGGALVRPRGEGDSRFAVFARASDAVSAAAGVQAAFHAEPWPLPGGLRVRMALHTGEADLRAGDYYGSAVNRCARLRAVGHGGQALISQATYVLVREQPPEGVGLLDLGEHRLKDLAQPERIYQLEIAGLPGEFPPLRTPDRRPNNLPAERSPLVGREKELAEISRLVLDDKVGLLTLTGPGGTGKTRLSLQAAGDLIEHFEDGAFYVQLTAVSDPALVVTAMAETFGLREDGRRPLLDILKDYLRGKQMLLVLDNFEQVLQAAPVAAQILAAAPRLKLLATSRSRLQVRGEREYPVPPLSLPDPKNLPDLLTLTQYESVRLFIDRARAVKPDFEINNENAPAVAEICARLDGLPLAIELAAARVRILPPRAMLSRLQSRLKLLTGGGRDLPLRQQTLRGAIDWSYDLLREGEQALFQRVSAFAGGCTFQAIEAVAGDDGAEPGDSHLVPVIDLLDGLESLVDKSLLRQHENASGDSRFSMLETIREYAQERLAESGTEEVIQRRHADFFLRLAEEAEPQLHGPAQLAWFAQLESEHDNLRTALEWAIRRREVETALRMVVALGHFWWVRGHLSEGRKLIEEALEPAAGGPPGVERGRALYGAALLCRRLGDRDATYTYAQESAAMLRELGDEGGLAWALVILAVASFMRGEPAQATTYVEEGIALFRGTGDRWGLANALLRYGVVFNARGDFAAAGSRLEEALELFRSLGDRWGTSEALNMLGDIARIGGDYTLAERLYRESLGLYREVGIKQNIPASLHNLGHVAMARGSYRQASEFFRESLVLHREFGNNQGVAESLAGLAAVASAVGEAERAARLFGAAAGPGESAAATMWPAERAAYERNLAAAQAQLDEELWQKAWQEGGAMSLEEAVEYALRPGRELTTEDTEDTEVRTGLHRRDAEDAEDG